jgi:hypothetical protein
MLLPEHGGNSGFGVVVDPFDASSEVRLHSSLLFLLDMIGLSRLLTITFTTTAFDRSSLWQFEASPYRAASKGLPSSFVQHDAFASS